MKKYLAFFVAAVILCTAFSGCTEPEKTENTRQTTTLPEAIEPEPLTVKHVDSGQTVQAVGASAEEVYALLNGLSYDKNGLCDCLPEYTIGTAYAVNISEGYARNGTGQAPLTMEQKAQIAAFLQEYFPDHGFDQSDAEVRQPYCGTWLEKTEENRWDDYIVEDLVITEIYADCFFATTVIPFPFVYKINGTLYDQWCVGDQVYCTYDNIYYDKETDRMEADLISIEQSTLQLEEGVAYKPVIYLYPEQECEVSVRLSLNGKLTCTYPSYGTGWQVTAQPDGTLTDGQGMTYRYLYWEGQLQTAYEESRGFCVAGKDTAAFLEWALAELGLNRQEANEFIVYWLPQMEQNAYNVISFQADAYTCAAELDIDPAPDTLIRVFMTWRAATEEVQIQPQALSAPERDGFTVVEWGGTRLP